MMKHDLCLFCEHFHLRVGYSDYECTPGEPCEIECSKGHWGMDSDEGPVVYRKHMKMAKSCEDFREVEE